MIFAAPCPRPRFAVFSYFRRRPHWERSMANDVTDIKTRDGSCITRIFTPDQGKGPWPGLVVFMDGLGWRQSVFDIGERLAKGGFFVMVPNLYYRAGPPKPFNPKDIFSGGPERDRLMSMF